jgi:hypothetical protein
MKIVKFLITYSNKVVLDVSLFKKVLLLENSISIGPVLKIKIKTKRVYGKKKIYILFLIIISKNFNLK